MSDQNQSFGIAGAEQATNIRQIILNGWALSMEVWLHHGFGSRYIGIQGISIVPIIFLFSMLWEGYDVRPVYCFLFCFIGMVCYRRAEMFWLIRRGERNHSRYSGEPSLMRAFPGYSELTIKKWVEPVYTAALGMALCLYNPPLGVYIFIGAIMLRASVNASERWMRARVREMNDGAFDQEEISHRFRDLRGDNY